MCCSRFISDHLSITPSLFHAAPVSVHTSHLSPSRGALGSHSVARTEMRSTTARSAQLRAGARMWSRANVSRVRVRGAEAGYPRKRRRVRLECCLIAVALVGAKQGLRDRGRLEVWVIRIETRGRGSGGRLVLRSLQGIRAQAREGMNSW